MLGGGTDNNFSYRMIIFAIAILVLLPTFISIYAPEQTGSGIDEATEELLDDYHQFTGSSAASESVWALTGIYTPYTGGGTYGYTDDGWLYGSIVGASTQGYTPSQYEGGPMAYEVERGDDGLYRYVTAEIMDDSGDGPVSYDPPRYETTADGHTNGDLYTSVSFDVDEKSDIFFSSSGRVEEDGRFYYEYSGYRYAFQPLADYTAVNADGVRVPVTANTTSLSLIWYEYYGSSGISGQLILSGSDSGVAYLTAQQIIQAFNDTTSTATFAMTFNGVDMRVHIRIDPYYLAQGFSIEDCYDQGYWSVMVSSISTDVDSINTTEFSFNVYSIFETLLDLFTFNTADYGISGTMGTIASLVMVVPLYAALISIGITFYPALIFAGILAAIQSLASLWPF